jgi:hypothetical protein
VVLSECKKAGQPAPSYNTIRARVKAVDLKEIVHHRVGLKAARDQFRPVSGKGLRTTRTLELFQIDHTPIDVIFVDEVDRPHLASEADGVAVHGSLSAAMTSKLAMVLRRPRRWSSRARSERISPLYHSGGITVVAS